MECGSFKTGPLKEPKYLNDEEKNCLGIGLTYDEWLNYWQNKNGLHSSCQEIFYRKIYSGENLGFSQSGFSEVLYDFNYMFSVYLDPLNSTGRGGYKLSSPGSEKYGQMQSVLIDTCSNNAQFQLQGACQSAAENICNLCVTEDLLNNRDLLKMCGCKIKSLPEISEYSQIPPECDPLCAQEQVVKNRNPNTGEIYECNSSVCVINDISISSADLIKGGIQFTQVCPQCINICTCIVDADLKDAKYNLKQYCGENSVCLSIKDGKSEITDCEKISGELSPETYKINIPIWVWVVFVLILIYVILVCFCCRNFSDFFDKNKNVRI